MSTCGISQQNVSVLECFGSALGSARCIYPIGRPADPLALRMMNEFTFAYVRLGREQAALELVQKHLALYEKSLDGNVPNGILVTA